MWVIEVHDGSDNPPQEFFFKGPSCTLGRSVEVNHISFHEDKSVSRKHIEIVVVNSGNDGTDNCISAPQFPKVAVKDLNSKFGTYINNERLSPELLVDIPVTGTVIKIGGGCSYIRIAYKTLSLCPTRLDKQEKEKLKMLAKEIQAKIVTKAEHATHVVCTKVTATIKSLIAIALKLKCITLGWLKFCETTNVIELIPPVERYFPPITDELQVKDIHSSRKDILSNLQILIFNEADCQYAYLMKACGASVVGVYALITQNISTEKLHQIIVEGAAGLKSTCVFFDENRGMEPEVDLCTPICGGVEISWLTAANLAGAVMELKSPNLLKDPPTKIRMTGYSQSQFQYGNGLSKLSDTQMFGVTSQPPLITPMVKSVDPNPSAAMIEVIEQAPITSKRKREDGTKQANEQDVVSDGKCFPAAKLPKPIDEVALSVKPMHAENSTNELSAYVSELLSKEVHSKRKVAEIFVDIERYTSNSIANHDMVHDFVDHRTKHPRMETKSLNAIQQKQGHDDIIQLHNQNSKTCDHDSIPICEQEPIDTEWTSVVHGVKKINILSEIESQKSFPKRSLHSKTESLIKLEKELKDFDNNCGRERAASFSPDVEWEKPITVERNLLSISRVTSGSVLEPHPATAHGSLRNVKCFVKNLVRKVSDIVSVKSMEKVLPKESEREIQLRLEFEAKRANETAIDALFSERLEVGKKITRKR